MWRGKSYARSVKVWGSGYGTRASRIRAARSKQRALIRAGRRTLPPTVRVYQSSGELKGVDVSPVEADVLSTTSTNGAMTTLNLVQQGSGSYNRVGRKVKLHSIMLKIHAEHTSSQLTTTGNLEGNVLRCILVWDKQPNGVLPTFDTIFGNTDQAGTESSGVFDSLRYDNTARFSVLMDKVRTVNPQMNNGTAGGTQNYCITDVWFKKYIKLGNRETVYGSTNNPLTIADVQNGALYLIYRAATNTVGQNEFVVKSDSIARLRYRE